MFHKEAVSGFDLGNKKVFWMKPGDFVITIVFGWERAGAVLGDAEAATFAALQIREPRRDFWFIFYSEAAGTYWVMPSKDGVRLGNENKGGESGDGKNKGRFTLVLANRTKAGWTPRPKFRAYENDFEALRG